MAWVYLFFAGVFEICWAVGVKYCDGFRPSIPLAFVTITMILSLIFLNMAIKILPMSVAYAVWSGIGIVGVFIYGTLILKEPFSLLSMCFIIMILIGIIGLKLVVK